MLGVGFKARLATLQEAMLWAKINRAWSGPERYASNDMQGVARSFPTSTWETRYDHTIRCWRSATVSGPRGPLHCDIASFNVDKLIPCVFCGAGSAHKHIWIPWATRGLSRRLTELKINLIGNLTLRLVPSVDPLKRTR